jgi:hypothetical protein
MLRSFLNLQHLLENLCSAFNHLWTDGGKEPFINGLLPSPFPAQIHTAQKFPAHNGSVTLLKSPDKFRGQAIGLLPGRVCIRLIPVLETQDHKGTAYRTADPALPHAPAESTGHCKGRFPVQTVCLAEPGKHCLGSTVALAEKAGGFINFVHHVYSPLCPFLTDHSHRNIYLYI